MKGSRVSRSVLAEVGLRSLPPSVVVAVKALACELPRRLGLPVSRFSMSELKRAACRRVSCRVENRDGDRTEVTWP
jgi:hypothetical protein